MLTAKICKANIQRKRCRRKRIAKENVEEKENEIRFTSRSIQEKYIFRQANLITRHKTQDTKSFLESQHLMT